jgi:hypothetical protein
MSRSRGRVAPLAEVAKESSERAVSDEEAGRSRQDPSASARLFIALTPDIRGGVELENVSRQQAYEAGSRFTMLVALIAGIAGAVVTLSVAPAHELAVFSGLAAAELVLALASIVIMARASSRASGSGDSGKEERHSD